MLTDLNWLTELVSKPHMAKPATLFDTLGVSTRETVISNVLAFYLDENEAHGLKRLFIDSLLACMDKDSELFPSPYTVKRERHDIDILIQGESNSWAIILENKIYHVLNNPLCEYWKRVSVKDHFKFGVVVSLGPLAIKEGCRDKYINITHGNWLEKIKRDFPENSFQSDESQRQELLYTDFMVNMRTLTNSLTNDSRDNEAIRLFQEYKAVEMIENLLRKQNELERYIQAHINVVFAKYSFSEGEKRFYYPDRKQSESKPIPPFRFFVENKILSDKRLSIYFELYGNATSMGPSIRDSLNQFHNLIDLQFDDNNTVQGTYYHLAHIVESALMPFDDFPAALDKIIGKFFAKGNLLVSHCERIWMVKQQRKYE